MTNPKSESTTLAALNAARADKTAKMVAFNDARIALETALGAVKSEGTPAARKNLTAAEQSARYADLELAGATERHDAATAAYAEAERAAKLTQHDARASCVSFNTFEIAATNVAQKIAEARARLAEVEIEASALVRGFSVEAQAVASEAVAIGAPGVPALDYASILAGLVAKAEGKSPGEILSFVWGAANAPGMSPEDTLSAIGHGVDSRKIAGLANALKDAVARQAATAKLVIEGHVPSNKAAPDSTPVGRFDAVSKEVSDTRDALRTLGFSATEQATPCDPLAARLEAAGAARVHSTIVRIRQTALAVIPGAFTPEDIAAGRAKLAASIASELAKLGLADVAAKFSTPRAGSPAPAATSAGFVSVGVNL